MSSTVPDEPTFTPEETREPLVPTDEVEPYAGWDDDEYGYGASA